MFWGSVISILIHSYTKIAISNIIALSFKPSLAALLMLIFYLVGFPIFVGLYMYFNNKQLKELLLKKHLKRNF